MSLESGQSIVVSIGLLYEWSSWKIVFLVETFVILLYTFVIHRTFLKIFPLEQKPLYGLSSDEVKAAIRA